MSKSSEKEKKRCSIERCESPAKARGWCPKHWKRWKAHGDPTYTKISEPVRGGTDEERFWAKVRPTGFCWEWTGATTGDEGDGKGHGYFNLGAALDWKGIVAHKFAYETLVGPVPDGLELDHLCRNTKCVNPDHLEPVTHGVNMGRGMAPSQQINRSGSCSKGHEMTEANTYTNGKSGRKSCRTCLGARSAAYHARKTGRTKVA